MTQLAQRLFKDEEQATKTIAWGASIAAVVLFVVIATALLLAR